MSRRILGVAAHRGARCRSDVDGASPFRISITRSATSSASRSAGSAGWLTGRPSYAALASRSSGEQLHGTGPHRCSRPSPSAVRSCSAARLPAHRWIRCSADTADEVTPAGRGARRTTSVANDRCAVFFAGPMRRHPCPVRPNGSVHSRRRLGCRRFGPEFPILSNSRRAPNRMCRRVITPPSAYRARPRSTTVVYECTRRGQDPSRSCYSPARHL